MKSLNKLFIVIGIILVLYGHIHWIVRQESTEVKTANDIMYVLPGWSLLVMGYIGYQCQACLNRKEE